MTEIVHILPTVRVTRVRFREDDVFEGSIPRECYDNATSEDFDFEADEEAVEGAIRVLQREGLSFAATGSDWAANPDGSVIVDYQFGEREEVTAHLIGFDADQTAAIIEAVG